MFVKEFRMSCKKITSLALVVSIFLINVFQLNASARQSKKVIKTKITEYKIDYINLDWWKNYDDEILTGYIVKAIEQNQDLKIATLKVEEANQKVRLQLAKEFPIAYGGVSPAINKMPDASGTEGSVAFPLLVNYEADIFLKNRDKTKSAKKTYESSKLDEKSTYIAISSQVGTTYFNIVKLDKLINLQEEIVASRKQIYDLMLKRNLQGVTSTADTVRSQKAMVAAENDLIELKKSRTILLNSLAVLTGDSPLNINGLNRIPYDELVYKLKIPSEIPSEVIVQRPDYLKAEKMVEKAGLDIRIAKKEFLPSISIFGLFLFNSSSLSSSFNWANALASMGVSGFTPLFTGGAKFANLKISKNKYEQILQSYYKTNLTAIQEVNDSLSSLKLDDEKFKNNLKNLAIEKADFKYTQSRYTQGVISNLDLLQKKENLLAMEKLVSSSKADCLIDYIGLYKAVGGQL